ncbi:MAG: DNA recombination protein RmuC [Candidatus Sedimenticola endophacoides]
MGILIENPVWLVVGSLLILLLLNGLLWWWQARQGRRVLRDQERLLRQLLAEQQQRGSEASHALQRALLQQISRLYQALERRFGEMRKGMAEDAGSLRVELISRFDGLRGAMERVQAEARLAQQEALAQGLEGIGRQLAEGLGRSEQALGGRMESLTESTDQRLREISAQVEQRLSEGFEKTTETFSRVLEHLGRIDEAQKRITELSGNVVSLQQVLSDKRSRGAFGEVQLAALVRNLLPEHSFALQHGLGNGTRVDCLLFLPEPTGNVAVDAKFPLESYRRLIDRTRPEAERARVAGQFRQDIRKHIDDIAGKYIIPGETADGAVMFIPSESVFAEIHAHHPELVDEAHRRRVWLVSPTTMMAILTTARAVLKDAATREQVHLIQRHLNLLSKDFGRFRTRMEKLSQHISQAHRDVEAVHVSARKISDRFGHIERVELEELESQGAPPASGSDAGAVVDSPLNQGRPGVQGG